MRVFCARLLISPLPPPATAANSIRRYADDAVNRLYDRVWNGRIHFGLWTERGDTIATAAARVPMTMAHTAGLSAADRVIEVGSGAARTAVDLARTFGCRITATNHSPAHQRLAKRTIAHTGLAHLITPAAADAHALPFADGAFTLYWAQEVLVHLDDKDRGFREARRVLAPNGRIVFTEQTSRPGCMSNAERTRVAERHGGADLWGAEAFAGSMQRAGFRRIEAVDWSIHLARHFAALVHRIEERRACLERDCGAALVAENDDNWRFAQRLAEDRKIGWHLFVGHVS